VATIIDLSTLGSAGFVLEGELEQDKAGFSVSSAGDVNGDGIEDFIIGAPDAGPPFTGNYSGGAVYVLYGKTSPFDARIDLASLSGAEGFVINGADAQDKTGFSVSSAGDLNGDGIDDILLGAPEYSPSINGSGKAYVIFGKTGERATIELGGVDAADEFIVIGGDNSMDKLGFSVSDAGDFNGDGFDDIVIGARDADTPSINAGKAYVIFGHGGAFADIPDIGALPAGAGMVLQAERVSDEAGYSVSSAGDVNGDGIDDLLVGAPKTDIGDQSDPGFVSAAGTVYVVFGKTTPADIVNLADMTAADGFALRGEFYDKIGSAVSSAGDVNGDGFDDIVVGSVSVSDRGAYTGAAYVLFGKASGFGTVPPGGDTPEIDLSDPIAAADGFLIIGAATQDAAGQSVSGAGDFNGDGFDDIIVGAIGAEPSGGAYATGEAYLIFGKVGGFGTIDLGNLSPAQGFIIQGADDQDRVGRSVSSGDINGDGFTDIIVGASNADVYDSAPPAGQRVDVGEAYVIFGTAPTTAVTRQGSLADQTIRGGAFDDRLFGFGGDDRLDGRGGDDRLDGGTGDDGLFGGAGNDVYVVRDAGDEVFENSGAGTDQVLTQVSHTLRTNAHVETLLAAPASGTAAINLGGSAFDNAITGNAGANRIDGKGGTDKLTGLGGNDIFVVDDNSDLVFEAAGGGNDRVLASGHYVLRAGVEVELLATLAPAGTVGLRLTGNELANTVHGNAGGNVLRGNGGADILNGFAGNDQLYGGTGKDLMTGGAGVDRFYFDTALSAATNVDGISDFLAADDAIYLDRAVFGGIGADGVLAGAAFRAGTAATDASDRIIYDSDTGRIYYDADGLGGAAQTLFARVDIDTPLTRVDFVAFSSPAAAPPPPADAFGKWTPAGEAALATRSMLTGLDAQWGDVQIA
jgi:Ca2+-binding RTX toxin-like protein